MDSFHHKVLRGTPAKTSDFWAQIFHLRCWTSNDGRHHLTPRRKKTFGCALDCSGRFQSTAFRRAT